jgi:hypothetical protein
MFVDRHALTAIPSSVRRQLRVEARHQIRDQHGVRVLGQWIEDETIYCILDALDAAAACQHHADHGLPCDDLHAVEDWVSPHAVRKRRSRSRIRTAVHSSGRSR